MIVHTKNRANEEEVFQVCQTDQGEQVWNADSSKLIAEGDFVEVGVDGVLHCIKGLRPIWDSEQGSMAGEDE